MVLVNEDLNPDQWTVPEQQAVYDELSVLLNVVPPAPEYSEMTDAELTTVLAELQQEMRVRPTTTITHLEAVQFGPATIFSTV